MTLDPFIACLTEIDRSAEALERQIQTLRGAVADIRRMREGGQPVSEIVARGPGVQARRSARSSWLRVDHALRLYRIQIVRSLVDGEHMTIAEAARVTGNARQVASRLYHETASTHRGGAER
jgi:hypothetical protein